MQTPFLQTELVTSQGKNGLEQDSKSIKNVAQVLMSF